MAMHTNAASIIRPVASVYHHGSSSFTTTASA